MRSATVRDAGYAWPRLAVLCAGTIILAGCGAPYYAPDELQERISHILSTEYKLDCQVQVNGSTINVVLKQPHLFANVGTDQATVSDDGLQTIGRVSEAIHRVGLSTRPLPTFYAILATDPGVQGASALVARRFSDVQAADYNRISPTEFQQRSVVALQLNPDQTGNLEAFLSQEIDPALFMTNVVSSRIRTLLRSEMGAVEGAAIEYACETALRRGTLACVITTRPQTAGLSMPQAAIEHMFRLALREIQASLAANALDVKRIRVLFLPTQALLDTTPAELPLLLDHQT